MSNHRSGDGMAAKSSSQSRIIQINHHLSVVIFLQILVLVLIIAWRP